MSTPRTALAGGVLVIALLAGACSDDDGDAGATSSTTTEATTASSETTTAPSSSEATEAPTSATTAPPSSSATTAPPSSETTTASGDGSQAGEPLPTDRQEWASELIRAWGAGDRERAAELATPGAVDALFGFLDPGGDDWALELCEGAAGSAYCTFSSASHAQTVRTRQIAPNGVLEPIGDVEVIA